jgi:hypothetical protein
LVPRAQVLDKSSRARLQEAAEGDPYVLRIRDLQLAKPWMELLAGGTRLVVDMEEWINKTSGRGTISIGIDHEDGKGPEELASWSVMLGLADYADVIPKLFAWADVSPHEETYHEAEYDLFQTECAIWDDEVTFYSEEFSDWRQGRIPEGLHSYMEDGEIGYWRLELTLNDLGQGFLLVDKFATEGNQQLTADL